MQLVPADFKFCYDECRPRIGNYGWMWRLLRSRGRSNGEFPVQRYRTLQRFGNPRRPLFIGKMRYGVSFVGDYRDPRAAAYAIEPERGVATVRFLESRLLRSRGAFLDVGSGLGIAASAMAMFLTGREEVLAFEACWQTARLTAATFALNGLSNVRLLPVAVGDYDGEMRAEEFRGGANGSGRLLGDGSTVLCRTLDGMLDQGVFTNTSLANIHPGIDTLRIVRGARTLLRHCAPALVFTHGGLNDVAPDGGLEQIRSEIGAASASYCIRLIEPVPGSDVLELNSLAGPPPADTTLHLYCEAEYAASASKGTSI